MKAQIFLALSAQKCNFVLARDEPLGWNYRARKGRFGVSSQSVGDETPGLVDSLFLNSFKALPQKSPHHP